MLTVITKYKSNDSKFADNDKKITNYQ